MALNTELPLHPDGTPDPELASPAPGPFDSPPQPQRRVRRRHYGIFFVLLTVLFSLGDVQFLGEGETGFRRLSSLYGRPRFFSGDESVSMNRTELAHSLGVGPDEVESAERVIDRFMSRIDNRRLGLLDWALLFKVGDRSLLVSYRIFLNTFIAFLISSILYVRARDKEAGDLIDTQNAQLRRLNEELRVKVREGNELLAELQRTQSRLFSAEKLASIGRLAATLAHEIRNPLCIIQSAAGMVADDLPADSPHGQPLELIRAEITRLDGIITQLLDFSAPKPVKLAVFNLHTLIRSWTPALQEQLAPSGVQLQLALQDDVGDVLIDADQFYQVLLNLVWNARDALGEKGGGRIEIATEPFGPRMISLTISDDGPGMPEDVQRQIFEPFYTTKTHGTGLGLAIVQQLTEGMGAQVRIDSQPGAGTSVQLLLPTPTDAARHIYEAVDASMTPHPRRRTVRDGLPPPLGVPATPPQR